MREQTTTNDEIEPSSVFTYSETEIIQSNYILCSVDHSSSLVPSLSTPSIFLHVVFACTTHEKSWLWRQGTAVPAHRVLHRVLHRVH